MPDALPTGGKYDRQVTIERHWWNGNSSGRGRRDVYIRTDGQTWEVQAQAGGDAGRSKIHRCPGRASAEILADAWRGGRPEWRGVVAWTAASAKFPADPLTAGAPGELGSGV